MPFKFELYFLDTETTTLDPETGDIVEISIHRFSDDLQRTWCIKPTKYDTISMDALRVNGHKLEDLKWQSEYGRETYKEASMVLPDIENYFMTDGASSADRILVGQNPEFDRSFMHSLWAEQKCSDTFPFGNRPFLLDTRQIAVFLDLVHGTRQEYYNLGSLIKKYGIKNSKAHTAAADVAATKELFMAQLTEVQEAFKTK